LAIGFIRKLPLGRIANCHEGDFATGISRKLHKIYYELTSICSTIILELFNKLPVLGVLNSKRGVGMDYTTVLSRFEALFSGNSGVYFIAALGALGIVGAHFLRMRSSGSAKKSKLKSKSYRHVVIAPYVDDAEKDPTDAMMPSFSAEMK